MKFCIMGGDLRNFFLAQLLSKEKNEVKIYGFEKLENFKEIEKYDKMISDSEIIILPIPFTRDKMVLNMPFSDKKVEIQNLMEEIENKIIFAGNMDSDIVEKMKSKNNHVVDIMKKEEFAVLNAIPTAEATIEIIFKHTKKILQGSHIIIMGFGRIGKVLAHKLKGLSANITCVITNEVEKAWAMAYGYETMNVESLSKNASKLKQYDVIINTIPKIILKEELKVINKETLIIDLASRPYGIDRNIVETENLNFIEALGLPRKICSCHISKMYERNNKKMYKQKKLQIIKEEKNVFRYYKINYIWNSRRNYRMVANQ